MAEVRIPSLTRDKLASFLPTHELIKAFEQLFNASSEMAVGLEDAQAAADLANATAAAGLALVTALADLVDANNLQATQIEQTRSELAALTMRLDAAASAEPAIESMRAEMATIRRELQQVSEGYLS